MPLAPRVLAQHSTATRDDRLPWVGCQPVAPHTPSRKVLILRTPYTTRTGDMQDPATQLLRIPLPRTLVNNANSPNRICQYPKGRTHRAGEWQKKEALPAHSQDALLGGS